MDLDKKDIGHKLKKLRESKNLTQESVGRYFELTKAAISRYEKGISLPPIDIFARLAALYGASVDWILGLDITKFNLSDFNSEQRSIIIRVFDDIFSGDE